MIGTRPEAIKMAPLINLLKTQNNWASIMVCSTGQHREMLDQSLSFFEIFPDFELNIMKDGQSLADITSKILTGLTAIFREVKPDIVLVHGDTTTAFTASLAAFYEGIYVGHVEAGLRTHNIKSPYPEEFNRRIIGMVSSLHFTPTTKSRDNLLNEGVNPDLIYVTGNTVIDSLHYSLKKIDENELLKKEIYEYLNQNLNFDFLNKKFILITLHRRENFGCGVQEICNGIKWLANKYRDVHFVFPVHMNPKVSAKVYESLAEIKNIKLIKPLNYENFIVLLRSSCMVLTDSGGIQEEAPSLGKPVLVMREFTERPEAVMAGTVRLIGSDANKIFNGVSELLDNKSLYQKMSKMHNPYGDGNAVVKILNLLKNLDYER